MPVRKKITYTFVNDKRWIEEAKIDENLGVEVTTEEYVSYMPKNWVDVMLMVSTICGGACILSIGYDSRLNVDKINNIIKAVEDGIKKYGLCGMEALQLLELLRKCGRIKSYTIRSDGHGTVASIIMEVKE